MSHIFRDPTTGRFVKGASGGSVDFFPQKLKLPTITPASVNAFKQVEQVTPVIRRGPSGKALVMELGAWTAQFPKIEGGADADKVENLDIELSSRVQTALKGQTDQGTIDNISKTYHHTFPEATETGGIGHTIENVVRRELGFGGVGVLYAGAKIYASYQTGSRISNIGSGDVSVTYRMVEVDAQELIDLLGDQA